MRLLVRSCVAATLMSIGVAFGVPAGAMADDPPKRGADMRADNHTVGQAGNFAYEKWPGQYFSFWTKFRGQKPKTAKDIRYFGFTAGAEEKVEILRRKFPLEVGRYKAVKVKFSWNHLWKAASQVGTYLDRKHPGLSDGTMSLFTGHNAFEMTFTRRAPKVKRYVLKRWKGAIRIKQPA